ncbi:fumarate hydratase [Aureococcus anophagefferens]|uniref:fumarate hydratase n=1 Tax=Aureococcus anophagefferens TaxID=44056 RepID=A0ABR1FRD9_AURAN
MNVNEVVANRAIQLLGGVVGSKDPVHPNDHVNMGQSSNDAFPTAMHVAAVLELEARLLPALDALGGALEAKAHAFAKIIKIGRTHCMDARAAPRSARNSAATPRRSTSAARASAAPCRGSGSSRWGHGRRHGPEHDAGLRRRRRGFDRRGDGLVVRDGREQVRGARVHDAVVEAHGSLNTVACSLNKIANDLRLLGSGPRCGFGELSLPAKRARSSIMPGKVNPTQCEAVSMVAARVFGNQTTVTFGGATGHFELNVFKPVMIAAFLESARLLADARDSFRKNCVVGVVANETRIAALMSSSLMLVTALNPHIGYDNAARVAKKAHADGTPSSKPGGLGLFTAAQFGAWVQPAAMIAPRAK